MVGCRGIGVWVLCEWWEVGGGRREERYRYRWYKKSIN